MNIIEVDLFTDGACRGNPGPGGYGIILRYGKQEKELWGGELETTNNRMELSAVIFGLKALNRSVPVTVHTDSRYVQKGMQEWITQWKKRNWCTADRKPVKNQDLWQQLDELVSQHEVKWVWVKGHSGHPENERADALAQKGLQECLDRG